MIKIMLVDDETWIRISLKNKIEWNDNMELCAEASDGLEALQLASNLRPDIVITDVRMPGMNGIDMLEQMRRILPDLQAIFISGYNEFEYVKSAIELSASGYVLKPIRKQELNENLTRCIEKIRRNNLFVHNTRIQIDLLHKMLEAFYDRQTVSGDRMKEVLEDLGFHSENMYVMLLRFTSADCDPEVQIRQLNRIATSVFPKATCTVFPLSQTLFGIFLIQRVELELLAGARSLIRHLSSRCGMDASISLGKPAHTCDTLAQSFSSARDGLDLMHFYSSHEIILPGQEKEDGHIFLPREISAQILEGIYSRNIVDLNRALNALQEFLVKSPSVTLSDVSHILHLLMGNVLRILCEQEESMTMADEGIQLMHILSAGRPRQEILNSFCSFCQKAASIPGKTASINIIIEKARHYLDSNYAQDITLKKMASMYYLNVSYFSVSFKNITGKNFNEYLTGVRIEHAKLLLSDKSRKVNQVAHAVGYEDCSYFGKTFRKITGITPAEFQRQVLSTHNLQEDERNT